MTDAVRAGIPVVVIDSSLKGDDLVSFVATDNYKGGKLAGDHLAERWSAARARQGDHAPLRRGLGEHRGARAGFLDAIAAHREIEVVSANQYGGATTESAFAASENLLAAHKGPDGALGVQGIFCPNESTTFGMLLALEDGGLAGKVELRRVRQLAQAGRAPGRGAHRRPRGAGPDQDGLPGGEDDGRPPARASRSRSAIDTGATLITRATMGTPEVQALLHPDFKKWLKE